MKIFNNFRFALFFSFIGIVVVSFAILISIAVPRLKTIEVNRESEALSQQLFLSVNDFSKVLGQPGELRGLTLEYANILGNRITVVDLNGRVLADSQIQPGQLDNHRDRPEMIEAREKGLGKAIRYSATQRKDLIYVAMPIKKDGKKVGFLRFAVPLNFATNVFRLYKSVWLALFISVIVAVLSSAWLARSFANPISRLSEVAKRIAAGNFENRFFRRSRYEVGELERAMERMSQYLRLTFDKLSAKKSQISAVLSSMNEGVLAVDREGNVILANPVIEKILGVTEPEIKGKTIREVVRNNEITELITKALRTGERVREEIQVFHPFEGIFEAHAGPVMNEENIVIGVVCVLHDISDLRKLEKVRSEFVANVSHELKTPLTVIRTNVENLLGGALNDPAHNADFVKKIDKHARNLSVLIDDILELSRLEAKKELGPFTRINMEEIMVKAIETIAEKAGKKEISIVTQCPGVPVIVNGIEDHLYRAVLNLLENAVNYSDAKGQISISCQREADRVKIMIADTGVGIAEHHLPRIFERFYRTDVARSRELGGTGLGLAIVKHVINLHNGTVEVSSVEGQGSTFTITLPLITA
ncbi:MAG: ATP-binding protein [Candidatus Margulisiibacteriota bacterium]